MATSIVPSANYVKFLRGTPSAYANLSPKDPDTLYYVYETNADHGVLYLGEKLISGSLSAATSLADLTDVVISAGIVEGSLLIYDGDHWVTRSLAEILEIIVGTMVGATANEDGESGTVPAPHAGDQGKYLRGDGTWANPTAALESTVSGIQDQLGTLIDNDINKSVRDIAAEEVNKIVDGAPEAFDTLREIAAWIVDNPDASDLTDRIVTIEGTLYTENTGLVSRVSGLETNLNGVSRQIVSLQQADQAFNTRITSVEEALTWQDMVEG